MPAARPYGLLTPNTKRRMLHAVQALLNQQSGGWLARLSDVIRSSDFVPGSFFFVVIVKQIQQALAHQHSRPI
jgi:hypothetical protein